MVWGTCAELVLKQIPWTIRIWAYKRFIGVSKAGYWLYNEQPISGSKLLQSAPQPF